MCVRSSKWRLLDRVAEVDSRASVELRKAAILIDAGSLDDKPLRRATTSTLSAGIGLNSVASVLTSASESRVRETTQVGSGVAAAQERCMPALTRT